MPGDILVADPVSSSGRGLVFAVHPTTGERRVFTDLNNADQGPLGNGPRAVALDAAGNVLLLTTGTLPRLFMVDPATGNRTILSDFTDLSQGERGGVLAGLAVAPSGAILVTDRDAAPSSGPPHTRGVLFSIDPITGNRTVLSDFGNSAQGILGDAPNGVAVEEAGTIIVGDDDANIGPAGVGTGGDGALYRVDQTTGNRDLVSDFANITQGPRGGNAQEVTIDPAGRIVVMNRDRGTQGRGFLVMINPDNGDRLLFSDFGNSAQGPLGIDPSGVAREASGTYVVIDFQAGTNFHGALFRVDASGNRTLLSDFGDIAQGPLGNDPLGVAVFSPPDLVLTKTGTPDPVDIDTRLTYTMQVTNNGLTAATGVLLTDTLPAGIRFRLLRATATQGSCTRVRRRVTCDLGTLASNDTVRVTIVIIPTTAGSGPSIVVTNTATVTADNLVPIPEEHTASVTTQVQVRCGGQLATIVGTPGDDVIEGTPGNDVIHGLAGNDIINGRGGHDILCGGTGSDTLNGGGGNDQLFGQAGNDTLSGGRGADACDGGPGTGDTAAPGCETTEQLP
jgi:uncharacterized repeat protein (TIGR01451 family)